MKQLNIHTHADYSQTTDEHRALNNGMLGKQHSIYAILQRSTVAIKERLLWSVQ